MQARAWFELSRTGLLQWRRSRSALLWTLLFPQVWLFMFAIIYRNVPGGMTSRMPGLFTITTFAGALFAVAYTLVNDREQGILRRMWVTPVTATTIVVAKATRSLVTILASLAVQAVVAYGFLGVGFDGSIVAAVVVMLFGVWAFVPIGMIMGSAAKDMSTAPPIANLIFFPMVFLSGAALPLDLLPGWLQVFGRMMPTQYLVVALEGVMLRGETVLQQAVPLAVLTLTGFVAFGFNSMLFRWESSQPISLRKLGVVVAGLAFLYLLAAILA
ncbi:MAG: ABC transporter permease [Acidobacteriota bacterium]|jgi:ABC-2 type transport system permease protein